MTTTPESSGSIERTRRIVSVGGLWTIVVCLVAGLALSLAGQPARAVEVFTVAAALLLTLPIAGVIAVFAEEVRRRDWIFAAAAFGVILLVGYRLIMLIA